MKRLSLFALAIVCFFCSSCMSTLKVPQITQKESFDGYKYVYITPTQSLNSKTGGVDVNVYGVYGSPNYATVIPADVISGMLIKEGFIRLPELNPELLDETLIVNYGESGRRNTALSYATEVTIQFVSAKMNTVVCTCTAEGLGNTVADDIRLAIIRGLSAVFED